MANKTHPGMFRCYEAALPDEPMFVLLGRDPAAPATIEFWANERNRLGKTTDDDDNARIGAALREAEEMRGWRTKIMDHATETGEPPAWRLPRPIDEPGDRPIRMSPELGMPYGLPESDIATDPTFRQKIAIGLRQVAADMLNKVGEHDKTQSPVAVELMRAMTAFVDRINGYAGEMEASKVDPYETFAASIHRQQAKPITYASFVDAAMSRFQAGIAEPGDDKAFEGERVAGTDLSASRDVTEIDTPELPPHRFAMFDKGKGWAYGRGLEINPTHIPAMLDRMEADGYTLVAALGASADKVGMIFQRGTRYSAFELAHGFGETRRAPEDSAEFQRFKAGEPLDDIREPHDRGRGLQP